MQSIDSLRELNSKLFAEIGELRKKFAEIKVENDELKARIAELLKQGVEENKRRDAENAELKARIEEPEKIKTVTTKLEPENAEFKDRITKVEQRQVLNDNSSNISSSNFNSVADQLPMVTHHKKPLVDKEMDTSLPEEPIPEVIAKQSVSVINIPVMDQCDQTSLEDKETDAFLDEVHKKKISDEIRQRNREEKLQAQESLPISSEEKRPHSITQPCNSTSSEVSANSDGGEVPPKEKICSEQDSKCKKGKGVNKLKQELFAPELSTQDPSIEQNQLKGAEHVTEISETLCPEKLTSDNKSSIDEASQHLAQLCDKAFDAEYTCSRNYENT